LATYTIGKGVVIMDTLSKYWTYQRNDSSSFRPSCGCSMKLLTNQIRFAFNHAASVVRKDILLSTYLRCLIALNGVRRGG